jgi:ABC-type multidrug transport system ATPase subunit
MLARVGLGADAGRRLESFSLGMLRRFGLAQAFLHEPDLLLLDEPTAGLDAPGSVVLEELLSEAHARGATLVIASHQLADILDHCDRLVILIAGRIAAAGTPRELLADGKRLRLEIEGLTGPELERIEGEIEKSGGRVISRGPARGTLIELYREGEAK